MKFSMTGVILFTQNYEDCVHFYESVLGLEVLHKIDREGERLTAFSLGGSYLMVETGGTAADPVKTIEQNPVKLRFNVQDVLAESDALDRKGVQINVKHHTWGTTAEFVDPDGNPCALRSDAGFGE